MGKENRRHARAPADEPVQFDTVGSFDSIKKLRNAGRIEDISTSGMFVATDVDLNKGDTLVLHFKIGGSEAFRVMGRIVWTGKKGKTKGVGIELLPVVE
jgi:hypothetical protein